MIQNILCFLEGSAGTYPDKPAFSDEHTSLTYRELLELSRRIGTYLGQRSGPRRPIPVMTEKNVFALGRMLLCISGSQSAGQTSEPDSGQPSGPVDDRGQ